MFVLSKVNTSGAGPKELHAVCQSTAVTYINSGTESWDLVQIEIQEGISLD